MSSTGEGGQGVEISVIIPARDSAATLGECLAAVFASAFREFEVIVADDGSRDATRDIAASFRCRLVEAGPGRGAASARNAGARAAAGRFLLFIDSDILLPPDAIGKAARTLRGGEWDAVVGRLAAESPCGNTASFYKNAYMHYTYGLLPPGMGVFYTSCAAVGADAFRAAGGFEECYGGACIEDTEMGGRLRSHGFRILLDKSLEVRHLRRYGTGELLATGFRRTSGIVKIMLRRCFGGGGASAYLTSPRRFTFGIALAMCACAALIASPFAGAGMLLAAFAAALCSLLLNAGFLRFILREGGARRAVLSAPLLLADQAAHGLGALHGVGTYIMGRRF